MDPTPIQVWRRSCVGCTKSKRRCSKETPTCKRCADRGMPCEYLPARPGITPENNNERNQQSQAVQVDPFVQQLTTFIGPAALKVRPPVAARKFQWLGGRLWSFSPRPNTNSIPSQPSGSYSPFSLCSTASACTLWFIRPDSFIVAHPCRGNAQTSVPPAPPSSDRTSLAASSMQPFEYQLRHFVESARSWLTEWVTHGASPLHHRHLYSPRTMPRIVQDAYSAVAAHMASERNRDMAMQIIDDRASELVAQQQQGNEQQPPTLLDHLSRVHALLAYQLLQLFSPDAATRQSADSRVLVLFQWSDEMWESAQQAVHLLQFSPPSSPQTDGDCERLWQWWIVLESVRRTWMTAHFVQSIYLMMTQAIAVCPGMIAFTTRKGVWDAGDAKTWLRSSFVDYGRANVNNGENDENGGGILFLEAMDSREMHLLFLAAGKGDEFSTVNCNMFVATGDEWGVEAI